jgi:hypothetical protein
MRLPCKKGAVATPIRPPTSLGINPNAFSERPRNKFISSTTVIAKAKHKMTLN